MYVYVYVCMYVCMYIYLISCLLYPLHSRDYPKKTSTKTNVATVEGNSRNKIAH